MLEVTVKRVKKPLWLYLHPQTMLFLQANDEAEALAIGADLLRNRFHPFSYEKNLEEQGIPYAIAIKLPYLPGQWTIANKVRRKHLYPGRDSY